MDDSLQACLRLVEPSIDPTLISPEALTCIGRVASMLPVEAMFGFECHLGQSSGWADFGVGLLTSDGSRDAFMRLDPSVFTAQGASQVDSSWCKILDFCRVWRDPGSPLHDTVANVAFEFDLPGPPGDLPIPCFLFQFKPAAQQRVTIIEIALQLLLGCSVSPPVLHNVRRCLGALPEGASVYGVGLMLTRGIEGVRLAFSGASAERWIEYATLVGWPGDRDDLARALGELPRMADHVTLNLDVGSRISPRIGFECSLGKERARGRQGFRCMFDHLVERGICLPDNRDACLTWIGHTQERAGGAWPESLRRGSSNLTGRGLRVFTRRINHMKVAYQKGRPLDAKAYLTARHTWLYFDAARQQYVLDAAASPDGLNKL